MKKVADLSGAGLVYLATPYSKYPRGIEAAFADACRLAARLVSLRISVYSPIAHTHPIAIHGELDPLAHSLWIPFDRAMMMKADVLLVAQMDGWQDSRGIAHEIDVFRRAGKPIYFLPAYLCDPDLPRIVPMGGRVITSEPSQDWVAT